MGNAFDWTDRNNTSIVSPPTDGIAVYKNEDGDVVVRQSCGIEDDTFIVIPMSLAAKVVEAIVSELT